MKASSKTALSGALLIVPLLALSGCIETSAPLCDQTNAIDVAGFDRDYAASILTDPSNEVVDAKITVQRTGVGRYRVEGAHNSAVPGRDPAQPSDLMTCKVGSWTVAESATKYGTYSQSILSGDGKITSMNQVLVSAKDLAAKGVSFEVVERTIPASRARAFGVPFFASRENQGEVKLKAMIVKIDSQQASEAFAESARPSAIGVSIH